jgi:hypothetical protein
MQFRDLMMLSDFIQVLHITSKHYTKNEHFPKLILFTTIYLFKEHKLNHRNYSEQEINMRNFVQATENDMHMYTLFGDVNCYVFL